MVTATGYKADGTEVTMWFTYRYEDYLKYTYRSLFGGDWTLFENPAKITSEE